MMKSKKQFAGVDDAKAFVAKCEAEFEERLAAVVEKVGQTKNLRLIGLSGPTCSGKTTAAEKLIKYLSDQGRKVYVVSIDDFYLDREVLEARAAANPDAAIDYDSEDTIDFDALEKCVSEVFTDEPTMIPEFDFISGKRKGYRQIDSDPNDLFIFEGIQAIYPKVTELFRHHIYKSVYISVESAIDVGGTVFQPDEIRLIRRIVRDNNFRGASPEFTLYLWESVRANEELNIFPYAVDCDFFINSALPFEINLLSPYLNNILKKVPSDNKYYGDSQRMLAKISGIEAVPEAYISDNSLCYEFIKKTK